MSDQHTGGESAAIWRRGMMHAVERLDLILTPGRKIPKVRYGETIEAARRALDEITELQRRANPQTYREAFDICTANYNEARAAIALASPSRGENSGE